MTERQHQEPRQHITLDAELSGNFPRRGVRFDPTINLGHIITFFGFLVAIFTAWSTLDKRVIVLEENRRVQLAIDQAQDARQTQATGQITIAIERLERQTERIADKLDAAITERGRRNQQGAAP